tara:strand:- start:2309 stop:2863 length:555 start_codon:yes stop_codon:yes gene_type:complete
MRQENLFSGDIRKVNMQRGRESEEAFRQWHRERNIKLIETGWQNWGISKKAMDHMRDILAPKNFTLLGYHCFNALRYFPDFLVNGDTYVDVKWSQNPRYPDTVGISLDAYKGYCSLSEFFTDKDIYICWHTGEGLFEGVNIGKLNEDDLESTKSSSGGPFLRIPKKIISNYMESGILDRKAVNF